MRIFPWQGNILHGMIKKKLKCIDFYLHTLHGFEIARND